MADLLELGARGLIVAALAYAAVVATTHWAVRSRRIGPFGAWPRLVRRVSDPVLLPIERRVMRAGGSPQDAPIWLLGIVVVGGLILISLIRWLARTWLLFEGLSIAGPRAWIAQMVSWAFTILFIALLVRVIGSWFGVAPYRKWYRAAIVLTDWLLVPIRRVLPPVGVFDFSPLVAYFVLVLLQRLIQSLLGF